MVKQGVIGWKVTSLNANIASVRYRCALPLLLLNSAGFNCRVFEAPAEKDLNDLSALVFVKSFSCSDYLLALDSVQRGIPIVLDLCDNIFVEEYDYGRSSQVFIAMSYLASAIVVTTDALADVVRKVVGKDVFIYVIPDGIENEEKVDACIELMRLASGAEKNVNSKFALYAKRLRRLLEVYQGVGATGIVRLLGGHAKKYVSELFDYLDVFFVRALEKINSYGYRRKIESYGGAKRRILWFGNHGAKYSSFGMLELLRIRADIEAIAKEFDVELVVVSNDYRKYSKKIRKFKAKTRYVEWSSENLSKEFSRADVVVIPSSNDEFSVCKSANRTVSSLMNGVPVVASSTPALEALSDCIVLDDFVGGLRLYLSDEKSVRLSLDKAKKRINELYGDNYILHSWSKVIDELCHEIRHPAGGAQIVLLMQLVQDLDLVLPVLEKLISYNVQVAVCCSAGLLQRAPRVRKALDKAKVSIWVLPEHLTGFDSIRFANENRVLMTASETNLGPHRLARYLTEAAVKAGIYTATMQHGFENVGLTYSDSIHSIKRVNFSSDVIYTWGGQSTLHERIPASTKSKCLALGCPKPERCDPADLSSLVPPGRVVIGIFENLHWHRYSDKYRREFVADLLALVAAYPEVVFLLKPHSAGMWLTSVYSGGGLEFGNLVVVDPSSVAWREFSTSSLMENMAAVITTPSTIAVDAARMGLPVAVVDGGLGLKNYAPLTRLVVAPDWVGFVKAVLASGDLDRLRSASAAFVERNIIEGDAAEAIAKNLLELAQLKSESLIFAES